MWALCQAIGREALVIDRDLSEAHSVLGLLAGAVQYDWKAAVLHFQPAMAEAIEHAAKVVELYPDYWLVHFALGVAQTQTGAMQHASGSLENALQLSPLFAMATTYLAALCSRAGDTERAKSITHTTRQRRSY